MTDNRVTQVAIEQWVAGSPGAQVTQVAIEHWSTVAYLSPIAAEMDGQAQAQFAGAIVHPGAAQMNGQAQVVFYSATVGVAEMDGQAQALFTGIVRAMAAPHMDGVASMAVTAPLGIHANMDGVASMTAVGASDGSGHHIIGMLQRITGSDRVSVGLGQTLMDNIVVSPISTTKMWYHWVATSRIVIRTFPIPTHRIITALTEQGLTVALAALGKFTWGRTLVQAFNVHDVVSVWARYATALTQLFRFADGFRITRALTLRQNISLHPSQIGAIGLKLLQRFLVVSASSPAFTYHFALAGRVVIKGILARVTPGILTQLFTVHPALGRQFITSNTLAQLLAVHPALTNKLILQLTGNFTLGPSQLVHMLYKGDPLLDGVVITALYISPSGTTTSWAVNTRTNAVTEYLNYNFRSFARMNDRYIAAGSAGLYELVGDTDDGTLIISELMSGYFQFNEKKLFGIKGAYVAIRGGGRFYLKLIAGDGREYVYELKAQPGLMTTKVRIGKGIRTTYMAFDLVTEGQDFDLDSLEFIPMTSGRRV